MPLIRELLDVSSNLISIDNFDYQELNELICFFFMYRQTVTNDNIYMFIHFSFIKMLI